MKYNSVWSLNNYECRLEKQFKKELTALGRHFPFVFAKIRNIVTYFDSSIQLFLYFQTCTIDNLPDKCLLHIFSFLHQRDLGKLARVCKKWRLLAYNHQLWKVVSLRPEYNGLYVNSFENLMALINVRFGPTLRYIELPCELVTPPILHELSNKCPSLKYMTIDFSNAMQLHDFNDLNSFPCNLRSLCICLSEVIFLEGFMRRIYSCLSSLQVLHLIGKQTIILSTIILSSLIIYSSSEAFPSILVSFCDKCSSTFR